MIRLVLKKLAGAWQGILTLACALGVAVFAIVLGPKPKTDIPPPVVEAGIPHEALYQASRIYGKAGCGDLALAELTAAYALKNALPPNVVAALVAVESHCNPLAISREQAVGLTQVVPRIWKDKHDFAQINLFNPEQNVATGTEILGGLVKQYGLRDGLRRYNGSGREAERYAARVLALAK